MFFIQKIDSNLNYLKYKLVYFVGNLPKKLYFNPRMLQNLINVCDMSHEKNNNNIFFSSFGVKV